MTNWHAFHDAMSRRFSSDSLISLATIKQGIPYVRTVNALYKDGAFYVITYAISGKMQHIKENPLVALCGEWFTGHGMAEDAGHILAKKNALIAGQLREAFSSWYGNGHINEQDPYTCILKITLTDGVMMENGTKYEWKQRDREE